MTRRVVLIAEAAILILAITLVLTSGAEHAAVILIGFIGYVCGVHDGVTKTEGDG